MSNEVTVKSAVERFQDHIREKIRSQIADAIPVDVLDEMTKKSVQELFYTRAKAERQKPGGNYYDKETYELPSFFEAQILTLAKPIIEETIKKWFDDNQQILLESWQKVFDDGIMEYVEKLQSRHLQSHLHSVFSSLIANLNVDRQNRGLHSLSNMF